jgi:hypothetical protein
MEKTTIYLPAELRVALRDLGRRTGRPQAEIIRDAVFEYMNRQERPLPRSIGIVSSGKVQSTDVEDWLEENWKPD